MATTIPASLKTADINRFAQRATQLQTAKPIVSYWCNYWIVNQILSKGLHNADQESLQYTTDLMDKLEQYKSQHAEETAVTDDVAGKAYVEQFGSETFTRADNAVRANKASKQTADTFLAAATFLELLQIWGQLEQEISSKVIYAKYHAKRILLAVKAGEDPNESNPEPKPEPEEMLPPLDPNDAEVQLLQGTSSKPRQPSVAEVPDETDRLQRSLAARSALDESLHPSRETSRPPAATNKARQPSVVEVPDDTDRMQNRLAKQSSLDESLHPSRAPSVPPPGDGVSPLAPQDASSFYTNQNDKPEVSPIESPSERKPSLGGNYFPRVPSPMTDSADLLPSAPKDAEDSILDLPSAPSHPSLPSAPTSFASREDSQPTPPPAPTNHHGHFLPQPQLQPTDPSAPPIIPPNFAPQSTPHQPVPHAPPQLRQSHGPTPPLPPQPPHQQHYQVPPVAAQTQPRQQSIPHPQPIAAPPPLIPVPNAVVDEEAMMKAQKHARWAISALNFEDVSTAIRELKGALAQLGVPT